MEPGDERCHPSKKVVCEAWLKNKAARPLYLRYAEMQKSAAQGVKQDRMQPGSYLKRLGNFL